MISRILSVREDTDRASRAGRVGQSGVWRQHRTVELFGERYEHGVIQCDAGSELIRP